MKFPCLALLTLLGLALPASLPAGIVYSGLLDEVVPGLESDGDVFVAEFDLDLDGNGTTEFTLQQFSGFFLRPGVNARVLSSSAGNLAGVVGVLDRGQVIGPDTPELEDSLQWSSATLQQFVSYQFLALPVEPPQPPIIVPSGPWTNQRGFFGAEFPIGEQVHYGWVQMDFNPGRPIVLGDGATLVDFAYESVPGQAIAAGAIAEPSTFGLLGGCIAFVAVVLQSRGCEKRHLFQKSAR